MGVERLHAKDYEDFLDLVDQVFSQDLIRVHFQEDMPLLFQPDEAHMQMQYAYRDEYGKLRAAIGAIPYTYRIGQEDFKLWTITNVATHYRYTGRGYMQEIFKRVFADMAAENVDLVVLHGNRERYRHMGFEMAGVAETAIFERYNIPSRRRHGEVYDFTFQEITHDDSRYLEQSLELFNKEEQHYLRTPENFLDFHHMWEGKAYAVLDDSGKFCGCLNYYTRFGRSIRELLLLCPHEAARVIYSFLLFMDLDQVTVHPSPFDPALNRSIYEAAEYVTSGQTTRMKLLRPTRFLQACLECKRRSGAYMPNGSLVLGSPLGRFLIQNDNGFTVEQTQKPAELTVNGAEIYRLLFGPVNSVYPLYSQQLGQRSAWFPTPFFIHYTDLY